jgi:hypothetical protein
MVKQFALLIPIALVSAIGALLVGGQLAEFVFQFAKIFGREVAGRINGTILTLALCWSVGAGWLLIHQFKLNVAWPRITSLVLILILVQLSTALVIFFAFDLLVRFLLLGILVLIFPVAVAGWLGYAFIRPRKQVDAFNSTLAAVVFGFCSFILVSGAMIAALPSIRMIF